MKTLIILERKNGWYGGYEEDKDGGYTQLFNADKHGLFTSIKFYTDQGYAVKCLDETQEDEFMKGRVTFDEYIRGLE